MEIRWNLYSCFTYRLMPALLKVLKYKDELVTAEIYLLSAVTALLKVVETLPRFLSPYLLDILQQVSHACFNVDVGKYELDVPVKCTMFHCELP